MPFAFLLVGTVLIVSGAKGTTNQLIALFKNDLQGKDGYLYWMVAILLIGSLGYITQLKNLSHWFLALVLVVLVLKVGNTSGAGGGFFQQFTNALQQISTANSASTTIASTSSLQNIPNLPTLNF